jgi:hypothetical protein
MKKGKPPKGEDLADGIIPAISYEAPLPQKKVFLPWHLPRKQYVRQHQWCSQIERLLKDSRPADGILKYLGLPGTDLLDLRFFHGQLCSAHKVRFRFLGFNTSAMPKSKDHTEMNISLDEVRRLPYVDPMSDVIPDNFVLLAKENSLACKRTRELGPYDVVNLDLCDGFGAHRPTPTPTTSYYDAVSAILALQARSKTPWLLLLTTRADKANIDTDVLKTLLQKYVENLESCAPFRDASREQFALETELAIRKAAATPTVCFDFPDRSLQVATRSGAGIPAARSARTAERHWVSCQWSFNARRPDLACSSVYTDVVPAKDPLGLAKGPVTAPNECTLSSHIVRRVAKRIDADKRLREDDALNQSMIEGTAQLLALARYNVEEYRKWARSH